MQQKVTRADILDLVSRSLFLHIIIYIGRPLWRSFSSLNRRGQDPDFFNAKLRINGTLWVGNVSVMENASDWYLYGMDKDKSYDNVILAVVSNADTDIRNSKGDFICVMPMVVPQNVAKRYLMLASDQGQALCRQNVKENCTRLTIIIQEKESAPTSSANGSSTIEAASRLPALRFSTSLYFTGPQFPPPSGR